LSAEPEQAATLGVVRNIGFNLYGGF